MQDTASDFVEIGHVNDITNINISVPNRNT